MFVEMKMEKAACGDGRRTNPHRGYLKAWEKKKGIRNTAFKKRGFRGVSDPNGKNNLFLK